jgi:hypothetical protein
MLWLCMALRDMCSVFNQIFAVLIRKSLASPPLLTTPTQRCHATYVLRLPSALSKASSGGQQDAESKASRLLAKLTLLLSARLSARGDLLQKSPPCAASNAELANWLRVEIIKDIMAHFSSYFMFT